MKNLQAIASECINELGTIGITFDSAIPFSVNTRATRRWGQCRWRGDKVSINISSRLLDESLPDFPVKNTVIHELLHALPDCKWDGHGKIWQGYARMVNEKLGYTISRTSNYESYGIKPLEREKYVFTCENCGQRVTRERKSKFVEHHDWYKCGCCGGRFVKGEMKVGQVSMFESR